MNNRNRPPLAVFGFLAPNFLGFLGFTLFPVILSFLMAFTNWTLKPAVKRQFLGLRNFNDLLGVRALDQPQPSLEWLYILGALVLCAGLITALWANVAQWRGVRAGGALMSLLGVGILVTGIRAGADQGVLIAGLLFTALGLVVAVREGEWNVGVGTLPSVLLLAGSVIVGVNHHAMWSIYEPRDPRFWQYFFNTVYLMLGIPFGIGGSLALALLLNEDLPIGTKRAKLIGSGLCLICGIVTMGLLWQANANVALLGGILWLIAALGIAFNVVAFRTIFYLPTFTAGVALMILWKALYNPKTGPINAGLGALLGYVNAHLGTHMAAPEWLASVEWAKPALIFMGVWTGIGGTNMLLYLAGLSNVPRELLDAAEVDGASGWTRFRHVTWPQLAPTTFFISIMSIIGGLQGGFEAARVMTNGGPAGSTTTLSFYIYNKAFQDLDLGYAAAISWVLFAIIFVATALNWKFGRELEVEQ